MGLKVGLVEEKRRMQKRGNRTDRSVASFGTGTVFLGNCTFTHFLVRCGGLL